MNWNVAACQMNVVSHCDENLSVIIQHIKEASENNANIICFPESCLIDDERHSKNIKHELTAICDAAKEYAIHVIFGTYLTDSSKKIRNQVLVIDKNGEVVSRYNKEHKYKAESDIIVAGHRNRIFELDGVRCAVFICWDYAFPEDMRELASKGTDVIFCPSYLLSHPHTKQVLEKIPQVRAFDTMSYFIMVDAVTEHTFKQSKICHPLRCLAELSDKNGIMYATLDISDLAKVRQDFPNMKQKK